MSTTARIYALYAASSKGAASKRRRPVRNGRRACDRFSRAGAQFTCSVPYGIFSCGAAGYFYYRSRRFLPAYRHGNCHAFYRRLRAVPAALSKSDRTGTADFEFEGSRRASSERRSRHPGFQQDGLGCCGQRQFVACAAGHFRRQSEYIDGTGSPKGVVEAGVGSTYHRTDGGAGASFYVKEAGSGSTGWAAK